MSDQAVTEQSQTSAIAEEELSLLDLLIVMAKHKWEILLTTLIATAFAVPAVMQVLQKPTPVFTASVKILSSSPKSVPTASAALAQLGGITLPELGGNAFVAMAKSDTVANKLIERFQLQTVYGSKYLVDARAALAGRSEITTGKEGVTKIEVIDEDPKRAAAIANGYVEEVRNLMLSFAITEAAQRRVYFEHQLKEEKDKLTDAHLAFDKTPRTSLEFLEVSRNFRFHESIYEVLIRQYETARLDEAKDAPMIQVLDKAVPPEKETKPKRTPVVPLSALAGLVVGILWAFAREALVRARSNPIQAERLGLLRRALWGR